MMIVSQQVRRGRGPIAVVPQNVDVGRRVDPRHVRSRPCQNIGAHVRLLWMLRTTWGRRKCSRRPLPSCRRMRVPLPPPRFVLIPPSLASSTSRGGKRTGKLERGGRQMEVPQSRVAEV